MLLPPGPSSSRSSFYPSSSPCASPRERRSAALDRGLFTAVTLAVNLPFALTGAGSIRANWSYFFTFTAQRPPRGTIWHPLLGHAADLVAVPLFAAGLALIVILAVSARARPGGALIPASASALLWVFATAKVYSPQYALWIFAALAIEGAPVGLAVAFAALDLLIFASTFGPLHPVGPIASDFPPLGPMGRLRVTPAVHRLARDLAVRRKLSPMQRTCAGAVESHRALPDDVRRRPATAGPRPRESRSGPSRPVAPDEETTIEVTRDQAQVGIERRRLRWARCSPAGAGPVRRPPRPVRRWSGAQAGRQVELERLAGEAPGVAITTRSTRGGPRSLAAARQSSLWYFGSQAVSTTDRRVKPHRARRPQRRRRARVAERRTPSRGERARERAPRSGFAGPDSRDPLAPAQAAG